MIENFNSSQKNALGTTQFLESLPEVFLIGEPNADKKKKQLLSISSSRF